MAHHRPLARAVRLLFWLSMIAAFVMATLPKPPVLPVETTDKVQHMAAFATLTLLMGLGWPRLELWRIGAAMALFGAAIELVQLAFPQLNRTAEIADWWADIAASAAALVVLALLRARARRRNPDTDEQV